ncbi:ABC transporter ATP-binding protein [Bifidobacterium samirii]|uniref:ABC transporter ATP-binding protein n=1 Tax=Bifidobacterium samirii TaxID=2306974 RepID=A0A430FWW2_9BIFI|nr:ABC transporter ATP-binding protein [Bifidobacterium samirii]RSX58708.1 ABC transporter ATP-binding protein [Bifidobacterium samirii]
MTDNTTTDDDTMTQDDMTEDTTDPADTRTPRTSRIRTLAHALARAWRHNLRATRIVAGIRPHWLAATALHAALAAALPYVTIWCSARLIDELAGARNPDELARRALTLVVATAAFTLLTATAEHWKNAENEMIETMFRQPVTDKLMTMDFPIVDDQRTADAVERIRESDNFAGKGIPQTLMIFENGMPALFQLIGGIILSAGLFISPVPQADGWTAALAGPWMSVVMFALMIGAAVASAACANRSGSYWAKFDEEGRFGNRLFAFFGIELPYSPKRAMDVRIYRQLERVGLPGWERNPFTEGPIVRASYGPMGLWMAASAAITTMLTGIVYVFVACKAWAGAFGIGSAAQYVGAITTMFLGIAQLMQSFGDMVNNVEFLDRQFTFLDTPNRMYQGSLTTEKRNDRQYDVEFQNVSFRYPNAPDGTWALRHINLRFRIGSRLAVVGENGSGKTTFIKLLCRLYDPTEGRILLNGIDIRKYRYDEYMRIFAVVFQDFQLFALPLAQNVASSAHYDPQRVRDCLEKAGFGERLASLPDGLDTSLYRDLDERGVQISGGEAQKIAIARALYQDAPFIILDEPTAALDPVAEAQVYAKFDQIAGDKTAVYISHRLSSCRFCDDIAVFDHGSIIQQGPHERLLADVGGKYRELWQAQAQYYAQ